MGNYIEFFSDEFTRNIFYRSLRLSLITTIICVVIGMPVSYCISLMGERKKRVLNSLILFPLLTNAVVRGFAWISILGRNGLLNQVFSALGLTSEPLHLLYTEGAIVVGSVYLFLPTVLSLSDPNMIPCYDPYSVLVYSAQPQNVTDVYIKGKMKLENGKFTFSFSDMVSSFNEAASGFRREAEKLL